jgi:predicted esterase
MSNLRSFVLRTTTVLFLTFLFTQVRAQVQTAKPGVSMCSNSNGFYEYLPQGYNTNTNQTYPLIVFVHGIGELGNGTTQLSSLMNTGLAAAINYGQVPASFTVNGQTFSFLVISPQFIAWPSPTDIDAVINYAVSHYRVDASRIYLTGLSMGGGAVWEYAGNNLTYASRVAAIVPIAGASWPDYGRARTIASANLPVWAIHNDNDPTVPVSYTNDYVSQINQAPSPNPSAQKTILSSYSHDAWTNTYNSVNKDATGKNCFQWMLQYSRSGNTGIANNKVPTASAGSDQTITLPANSISLNGSGSDADGTIASYQWSEVFGPNNATFSNAGYSASCTASGLIQGTYTFKLTVTDNSGATASASVNVTVNASTVVTYTSIPGKIEAENYSSMYGIQTENTLDAGGGKNVGWQDNNDWMDYGVNVATAGTYTIDFRVATPNNGSQFQLRNSSGSVLATVNVPNTGSYQTWQTVSAIVTLPAGQQTLRVYTNNSSGGWNLNWMNFSSGTTTTPPPPSTSSIHIEAESYSSMYGILTEPTSDAGGGKDVGYQDNNDWMDYSANIASAGSYTVNLRVASLYGGGQFQIRNSSGTVLATVNVPSTGGYQTWQTVSTTLTLPAGQQTLRIFTVNSGGGWNLNWFDILASVSGAITTASKDSAVLVNDPASALQVFPNPVEDRFALKISNSLKGQIKISIVNTAGQQLKQFILQKTQTGTLQSYLSVADLPKGDYILTAVLNQWKQSVKLIKN